MKEEVKDKKNVEETVENEQVSEDMENSDTTNAAQEEQAAGQTEDSQEQQDTPEEEAKEPTPEEVIADLKDKYLRSVAEFDNYRKRTLKEKAELILNGSEKTVAAILPVIDDMERAMANGEKTDDPAVLREGMELIFHKFMKALEGLGVKKIDTENADFNTDLHEAVAMVPGMGDDKKGKVIDCLQTGYQLNDKVIRHAKVAVGQ